MSQRDIKNTIPKGGRYMPCEVFCWKCGKQIKPLFGVQYKGRFCDDCYEEHASDYKATLTEYLSLKTRVMIERAFRFMEKAGCNMTEYKKAAEAVKRHAEENPEQYKSAHEVIAAVVLLKNGYDISMNHKIGRYMVDLYLPEKKVCVEIDGEYHNGKELQDSHRDTVIRQTLGEEWEVVRIPTKHIEENPDKIPDAISAIYEMKKKLRKQNGGFLPNSYSKREQAKYARAMVYETVRNRV